MTTPSRTFQVVRRMTFSHLWLLIWSYSVFEICYLFMTFLWWPYHQVFGGSQEQYQSAVICWGSMTHFWTRIPRKVVHFIFTYVYTYIHIKSWLILLCVCEKRKTDKAILKSNTDLEKSVPRQSSVIAGWCHKNFCWLQIFYGYQDGD